MNNALKPIVYNSQSALYLFDQSDPSNVNRRLAFTTSAIDDGNAVEYTNGVEHIGAPGDPGAYIILERAIDSPVLYYYCPDVSGMGERFENVSIDQAYQVSTAINDLGQPVFSIYDISDQTYYNQTDIPLETKKTYYFDTSDPNNNGYELTFGTGIDSNVIPPEYVMKSICGTVMQTPIFTWIYVIIYSLWLQ